MDSIPRRTFFSVLSSLPFLGFLKPREFIPQTLTQDDLRIMREAREFELARMVVVATINRDDRLRLAYHANIAMCLYDNFVFLGEYKTIAYCDPEKHDERFMSHDEANRLAAIVMRLLFDVPINKEKSL